MKRLPHHLVNEARLSWYLRRRYWFETLLALAVLVTMFGGLLYAVSSVSEARLESGALDGMIVSFALWVFAVAAYGSASNDVAEETRQRTLEQLYLSPLPLARLLGIRAGLNLLEAALILGIALLIIYGVTEARLHMRVPDTMAVAMLAAPALMGVGYLMAGVLLLAKKAEMVHVLFYPALIALVAVPAYPFNALYFLPFAAGAGAARAAANGEVLSAGVFALVALNSIAYLVIGVGVYRWAERQARRLGILGHF